MYVIDKNIAIMRKGTIRLSKCYITTYGWTLIDYGVSAAHLEIHIECVPRSHPRMHDGISNVVRMIGIGIEGVPRTLSRSVG